MVGERIGPTVVEDAFEELALALGGVVAAHAVPDDAVWDLARVIDHARRRATTELNSCLPEDQPGAQQHFDAPHPAITLLLRRLREIDRSLLTCELSRESRSWSE